MSSSSLLFIVVVAALALCASAQEASKVQEPQQKQSPPKLPLCSCEDQQKFFQQDVKQALQQAFDQCRQEVLKVELKDQPKVEQCFQQEQLHAEQLAMECMNMRGRNLDKKTCETGSKKGEEIVNMPSGQMLAYMIDQIYVKAEDQLVKISQASADLKFGPIFQKQMQCMRLRLTQKLQQIDVGQQKQCEFNFDKSTFGQMITKECMSGERYFKQQLIQQVCLCAAKNQAAGATEFCPEAQKQDYFQQNIFDQLF